LSGRFSVTYLSHQTTNLDLKKREITDPLKNKMNPVKTRNQSCEKQKIDPKKNLPITIGKRPMSKRTVKIQSL